MADALYPLKFTPIYKEKVWGGRALETLGRDLPGGADTKIGESWELVDLAQTMASGGGGGAERSVIADGPLAGTTLHAAIQKHGKAIIGDLPLTDDGNFPLLVKFLDAHENLSVQVHPKPEYAAAHADAFLKSECWYVVDCEPDAAIYKGVTADLTPETFRTAIADGTIEQYLIKVPVKPGDFHYLPSGTCHALGAGVLVAEVQTPSDTTFRVYDWGRTGRELHVEQAIESMFFEPADTRRYEPNTRVEGEHATVTHLGRCEYFVVDKVEVDSNYVAELPIEQPTVWTVLSGSGTINVGGAPDVDFEQGETLLLPPAMHHAKVTVHRPTTWLETTFPQARKKQIA